MEQDAVTWGKGHTKVCDVGCNKLLGVALASGAGKSTLLNTLAGRVVASSGSITINGEPVSRKARRKISYVLQADVFFPNLTLRETLTVRSSSSIGNLRPKIRPQAK